MNIDLNELTMQQLRALGHQYKIKDWQTASRHALLKALEPVVNLDDPRHATYKVG
ncbi:MAG: hypothetical protein AMXMBFR16_10720 [Candidatus Uhrbacteria bacterium]